MTNRLSDFDPEKFTIFGFCEGCGHSAPICRDGLDPQLTVHGLIQRLRCGVCGSSEAAVRIVYTGAGGFSYGIH